MCVCAKLRRKHVGLIVGGQQGKLVTWTSCLRGYSGSYENLSICNLGNKDNGSQKSLGVCTRMCTLPLVQSCRESLRVYGGAQAGLVPVAGHAVGGWEPGHRREQLLPLGPRTALVRAVWPWVRPLRSQTRPGNVWRREFIFPVLVIGDRHKEWKYFYFLKS